MNNSYIDLLCCPNCFATVNEGLQAEQLTCKRCQAQFFNLDGVLCLFPAGDQQKALWDHLLAEFIDMGEQQNASHLQTLSELGLTLTTKKRLENQQNTRVKRQQSVVSTLQQAGLKARKNKAFNQYQATGFSQYYDLILRDWGWTEGVSAAGSSDSDSEGYRTYQDENALSLEQCKHVLESLDGKQIENCLVLGAGAGRLSWDLHCLLRPKQTLAIDNNPLLAYVSHCLVKGKNLPDFYEERVMPHQALPVAQPWKLQRHTGSDEALHQNWNVMAADAWALPLKEGQFDLIVTPWFIDVCGQDAKTLLGLVDKMLKPSGYWLNHGPLLYLEGLPVGQHYSPEELRQLMGSAKFHLIADHFKTLPYSHSPYSQRGRMEDCWTFLAQSAKNKDHLQYGGSMQKQATLNPPANWLTLTHLPIPDVRQAGLFPEALHNIEILIDGTRSVDDLVELFEGKIPGELTPRRFVEGVVRDFLVA